MDRYKKAGNTRRINKLKRYRKIQAQFDETFKTCPPDLKYTYESVVSFISNEFGYSKRTIVIALKTDCSELDLLHNDDSEGNYIRELWQEKEK